MLRKAKFPVDNDWNLLKNKEHQADVLLYVKTIMGLTAKEFRAISKTRAKGDRYSLTIDSNNKAWLKFSPDPRKKTATYQKVYFSSSDLLRGIFSTYISKRACNDDLKDKLPEALLAKILLAYAERDTSGNLNY